MSRYLILYNPETEKKFVVDTYQKRLARMRSKINAWVSIVSKYPHVQKCMVTLTYDTAGTLVNPSEWRPKHVSAFINHLKKIKGLEVLAYAWVCELQDRGVPHYHVLLVYRGYVPFPDQTKLWKYGMSNILFDIKTLFYIMRYTGKAYQKNFDKFPKGARLFACGVMSKDRDTMSYAMLTDHQKKAYDVGGMAEVREVSKRPEWLRSQLVGYAETKKYADFLVLDNLE
ncbi:MAG: hypothetical protein H7836_15615 [Magnetococcus sp. YQC-3]